MEITFLGTGAGIPSTKRNVSSTALRLDSGDIWLFDCGEATQHQILSASITLSKITKIFITHLHGDHIFGLPGLLGSRSFQGGESELVIYGPKGIKSFIETALRVSKTHLRYSLRIDEIEDGIELNEKGFTIRTGLLEHGIDSYGYRVEEDEKTGPLIVDKLKELGVKPGPIYKKLKDGESIEFDGRFIRPNDVIGPAIKGRCIVICGDTRYSNRAVELAKGADLLVHEATFSQDKPTLAHDYFHSTSAEAAHVANRAEASWLIVNHISSRYQDEDVHQLLNEARAVFPNTDIAFDQMIFSIPIRKAGSS